MKKTTAVGAVVVAMACAFTAGAFAAGKAKPGTLVTAADIKWQPLDPSQPDGAQIAVISGDMKKGPRSLWMLKAPAGVDFPIHSHGAAYNALVVQGTWKHTFEGQTDQKTEGGPGTYWHQPAKQMHGDGCAAGGGDCIIAIELLGKHDFIPKKEAPAAK